MDDEDRSQTATEDEADSPPLKPMARQRRGSVAPGRQVSFVNARNAYAKPGFSIHRQPTSISTVATADVTTTDDDEDQTTMTRVSVRTQFYRM